MQSGLLRVGCRLFVSHRLNTTIKLSLPAGVDPGVRQVARVNRGSGPSVPPLVIHPKRLNHRGHGSGIRLGSFIGNNEQHIDQVAIR